MACGLFGKLPARRDFLAIETPRQFLAIWEPWLQGAMSSSMLTLGNGWKDAFLMTPLWRFWIGDGLCGSAVAGVLMPSLDGVGRYFPLTVFAAAPEGQAISDPIDAPQDAWYEALEHFCLDQLDPGATFEAMRAGLPELPMPATVGRIGFAAPQAVAGAELWLGGAGGDSVLPQLAGHERTERLARSSIWWTLGGADHAAAAFRSEGLPDVRLFTGMMTGDYRLAATESAAATDDEDTVYG